MLCPQNQIVTRQRTLYFLTAGRRDYNSDCWNDITSAPKQSFAQYILSQNFKCLQSDTIFEKQSNCQQSSTVKVPAANPPHRLCSEASQHLPGEPLQKSWWLIPIDQRELFCSDFQRLWSPLSSVKWGRLHLITMNTYAGRKYSVSQYRAEK